MSDYWQDKQVIVTGGCGMVGSRLCEFLRTAGAQVFVFDDMSRSTYRVDGCFYHVGDAGDEAEWYRLFAYKNLKPFAIFNLAAAVGGVYYNLKAHTSQFVKNVRLQSTPAIIAAEQKIPVFLQTSSVCIYAKHFNSPALETLGHVKQPERANEGYAWAKRMGEHICKWTFGDDTRWVVVRPTNIFGIRDYFDERAHVIPALIKKFLTQDEAIVYGGNQTREFIYADDVARGMMIVAERGKRGEAYNLGTSGETQITIQRLAETIYHLTDSDAEITLDMNAETGDETRCTDSSKARALGWRHHVDLVDGLERVIEWYKRRNES